jgi:hypothetical protein
LVVLPISFGGLPAQRVERFFVGDDLRLKVCIGLA